MALHPPISVFTSSLLGRRKVQEDRTVIKTSVCGRAGINAAAVFDGTVCDTAVDFTARHLLDILFRNENFLGAIEAAEAAGDAAAYEHPSVLELLRAGIQEAFRACDALVIEHCRERGAVYSACTAAVALITNTVLTVAHVGDSRVAVGSRSRSEVERNMVGNFLTIDHKPNQPAEQRRVLEAGGQVVYLHNDRPFLRGGDFLERQARGERPMQLNYARAFGGADLKPYGLTVDPDFHQIRLSARDELVLLGSDGLWDVLSPTLAARRAKACLLACTDPALELTHAALSMHEMCGTTDNISAIVLQLSPPAAPPVPARGAAATSAAAAAVAMSAVAASGAAVAAATVKQLAASPSPATSLAAPAGPYPDMMRRHGALPPIRSAAA